MQEVDSWQAAHVRCFVVEQLSEFAYGASWLPKGHTSLSSDILGMLLGPLLVPPQRWRCRLKIRRETKDVQLGDSRHHNFPVLT